MTRAKYRVFTIPGIAAVFAEDRGKGEVPTITNDAEAVVRELITTMKLTPLDRIFYKDTNDTWDELKHDGGKFTGFRLWDAKTPAEVVLKAHTVQVLKRREARNG